MTPIMVADGWFAAEDIGAEFDVRARGMDAAVREFIRHKIREAGSQLAESRTNP
jgi:hypothetical protein